MTASGLTARPANDDVSQHAGLAVPDTGGACGTVFLSVPAGHHVADLLRGPFLRSVLAARPCPKIVVLSPFASDGRLAAELDGVGVECQPLPDVRPRVAARVVDSVLSEKFLLASRLRAVRLQRDRARLLDPWRGRRPLIAFKAVL